MGYLSEAVDDLDLIDGVYGGRQAAVDAEDLVVDDDRQGEEVEHICKVVPHVCVAILAGALGVEAVRLCDAAGLVVAADEMDAVRVAQLQAYEERYGLDGEEASVDVVTWEQSAVLFRVACHAGSRRRTQEQIVGVRAGPANLENLHHVEELAVDVAHDGDGRADVHHVALLHEQLLRLCAYRLDHRLGQQLLLGQARYTLIEVYGGCGGQYAPTKRMGAPATDVHGSPGMAGFVGCVCGLRHARRAQGVESILVASMCRYRTIIAAAEAWERVQAARCCLPRLWSSGRT